MKLWNYILAIVLGLCSISLADEWANFARPGPIYDEIFFGEETMLATGGGIRLISPKGNSLFSSANGLGATTFFALAQNSKNIYAISEYGLIAAFDKSSRHWSVVNRSFLNNRSKVIPGEAIAKEQIIVIAFEDRMAFFDCDKGTSFLTINKIGNLSLSANIIDEIAILDTTLYVAFGESVYSRAIDWNNIEKDFRLVDPESWKKEKKNKSSFDIFKNKQDLLKKYGEPLFNNFAIYDIYELTSVAGGGVIAASTNGYIAYSNGRNWNDAILTWDGYGNYQEAYNYRMKALSSLSGGLLFYHVWGQGFKIFKENGATLYKHFSPYDETSCLDEVLENYTVATGTTIAPDSSGFLAATSKPDSYGLVYITKEGKISCLPNVGTTAISGPIIARIDETSGEWVIYVSVRDENSASLTGSLDEFRVSPPSKKGGRLVISSSKNYNTPDGKTPIDFTLDKKNNALWFVTAGSLSYLDFKQDEVKQPQSMKGLMGAEYTSIDYDIQGNVWVGTFGQGVYRLSKKNKSLDTLSVLHFTTKDGLLHNEVNDIAIDPVFGMAWFAHAKGVSRYTRSDLRDASIFMTSNAKEKVKVYPNPFRPKLGQRLIIDNISESSVVSIFNHGGTLVRSFYGNEILGGKAKWDGNGKDGNRVSPGVYHYVVRDGSKVEKGKLILIH